MRLSLSGAVVLYFAGHWCFSWDCLQ